LGFSGARPQEPCGGPYRTGGARTGLHLLERRDAEPGIESTRGQDVAATNVYLFVYIHYSQEQSMKRVKTVMYLLGVGYLGLHLGTAMTALADNDRGNNRKNCELKGTYVWTQDGFEHRRVSTADLPEPYKSITALVPADRRPFAYAGREKYDGHGNVTGINTVAVARGATFNPPADPNAPINPPVNASAFVTYSGTYVINSDCTAVVTVHDDAAPDFLSVYHLFLTRDGEKFTFILYTTQAILDDENPVPQDTFEYTGVGVAHRVD
jgi:hypothetical protein